MWMMFLTKKKEKVRRKFYKKKQENEYLFEGGEIEY